MKKFYKNDIKLLIRLVVVLVVLNVVGTYVYKRFDFTQDHRYTLSESTLGILDRTQEPVLVEVFLKGNFPLEFRRLQNETKQLLEEIAVSYTHLDDLIFIILNF